MKTLISSNSRPLRRALCTLLVGIAAILAIPGNALVFLTVDEDADFAQAAFDAGGLGYVVKA